MRLPESTEKEERRAKVGLRFRECSNQLSEKKCQKILKRSRKSPKFSPYFGQQNFICVKSTLFRPLLDSEAKNWTNLVNDLN